MELLFRPIFSGSHLDLFTINYNLEQVNQLEPGQATVILLDMTGFSTWWNLLVNYGG